MSSYITSVNNSDSDNDDANEAKDELERSIVANLADEVKVNIVNSNVEVTIFKSFG